MLIAAAATARAPRSHFLAACTTSFGLHVTYKREIRYKSTFKTPFASKSGVSSVEIDDDGGDAAQSPSSSPPAATTQQQQQQQQQRQRQRRLGAAWYFLGGASGALLFPYLPVFLADRGLSPAQVGLVSALRPWIAAPAGLLAAAAADARGAHRPLLLLSLAAASALHASLPWIGGGDGGGGANEGGSGHMMLAALLAAEALSFAGVLGDATVLSNLESQASFGALRVWASVGFGAFGLAGGAAIAAFGLLAPFVGFGALSALMLAVGAGMRYSYDGHGGRATAAATSDAAAAAIGEADKAVTTAAAEGPSPLPPLPPAAAQASVWAVVARPGAAVFLFQATMLGAGMGMLQTCAFLYLQALGGGPQLMGLCIAARRRRVPAFALQRPLLARFGVDATIDAALAVLGARLLLYALAPPAFGAWCAPLIDTLHGRTFAAAWAACTARAAELAPPRGGATLQGVMQAAYLGAGVGIGGLAGGALVEAGGGGARGGAFAFAAAGAALLLTAGGAAVARRRIAAGGARASAAATEQQQEEQNK